MAICRTCGATIEVPEGWSVGPAARRHYWAEHPDTMLRHRADRAAEESLAAPAQAPAPAKGPNQVPTEPATGPKPKRRKA